MGKDRVRESFAGVDTCVCYELEFPCGRIVLKVRTLEVNVVIVVFLAVAFGVVAVLAAVAAAVLVAATGEEEEDIFVVCHELKLFRRRAVFKIRALGVNLVRHAIDSRPRNQRQLFRDWIIEKVASTKVCVRSFRCRGRSLRGRTVEDLKQCCHTILNDSAVTVRAYSLSSVVPVSPSSTVATIVAVTSFPITRFVEVAR